MKKQNWSDRFQLCARRTAARPCYEHLESVWSKFACDARRQRGGRPIRLRGRAPQVRERRKRHDGQRECGGDDEWDRKPRGHGRGARWLVANALLSGFVACAREARPTRFPRGRRTASGGHIRRMGTGPGRHYTRELEACYVLRPTQGDTSGAQALGLAYCQEQGHSDVP